MKDRKFGVEIEFDSNGLGRDGVLNTLREAFRANDLRFWYFDRRLIHDGSEFELMTPPLCGVDGFKKLQVVMNSLSYEGCFTTGDDGLHVHHDAPEFVNNMGNAIRLVKSWQANRHLIYQFVNEERIANSEYNDSYGHWACPAWSNDDINYLERNREVRNWERKDLNLLALNEHGTIEIRLHEGTLHYPEAESWIKFGQQFIDRSLKHSIRESKDASNLLQKIRVSKSAEKQLISKTKWR